MTEKQYRLNKWGTRLLKNNRPLFDWTNESDEIVDLLNFQDQENKNLRRLFEIANILIMAHCDADVKESWINFKYGDFE